MSGLLPCPFCGVDAGFAEEKLLSGRLCCWQVYCRECHCGTPASYETSDLAAAAWNLRAPPASPTGRQLGPGKRDELPPIVSEVVPVWPAIGEIAKAGWAWRNDKERETDSDDQRYFEHNWHSLPGLGEYVKAEILKRPEFARSAPPIVSEGVGGFTPGPWVPSKFGFQVLTGDSWSTVCTLKGGACWEDGRGGYLQDYPWECQEANARLIAAAPDLLEALRAMVEAEVEYMTRNLLGDPEKQHNVIQARSALSKATGEGG